MESPEIQEDNPTPGEETQEAQAEAAAVGDSTQAQESSTAGSLDEPEHSPAGEPGHAPDAPHVIEEIEVQDSVERQADAPKAGSRLAYIAFFVVLLGGILVIALIQFNRALSLPSTLTALLSGSQTTASGLVIEDLATGSGPEVKAGDAITVNYTGFLEDGTQFNSSITRGEPYTFLVGYGSVIPGWDEGVVGMQEGGVRRLTVPPDLAYGEAGAGGGVIPPNATLEFELELLGIHTVEIEQLVEGQGEEVALGDNVTLAYIVWLMDGTQIDSSATSGQPIIFTVGSGQMLPGIEQGIAGMKPGEKRLVTVPPELAFGSQGLGDLVPPDSTLQFELELVDVQ